MEIDFQYNHIIYHFSEMKMRKNFSIEKLVQREIRIYCAYKYICITNQLVW